jgi:predicted lipoprotein with Yx(FWY)xxD motif
MALVATLPTGAAAASTSSAGVVVSAESSPFGKVLSVGSGPFAGYSLYEFDRNTPSGCTTSVVTVQNMPLSCTGTETDKSADWPALTTVGRPLAGTGVDQKLLGTVYRKDIGAEQVTYGGQLLYLFDTKPHVFQGVNFMETVAPLPPWRGVWYLVSPKHGQPVTGAIGVSTQSMPAGTTVLAADMFQGVGTTPIVVYTYSKDKKDHSTCVGACALAWVPVLTTAPPDPTGLPANSLGEAKRADGSEQLTFDGKPLYFYSEEVPRLNPATGAPADPATTGTGNLLAGPAHFGGTFSLVQPPTTS